MALQIASAHRERCVTKVKAVKCVKVENVNNKNTSRQINIDLVPTTSIFPHMRQNSGFGGATLQDWCPENALYSGPNKAKVMSVKVKTW